MIVLTMEIFDFLSSTITSRAWLSSFFMQVALRQAKCLFLIAKNCGAFYVRNSGILGEQPCG